jgi:hypothetical protein
VDNNTWNNTHIATVGRAMSSNESAAYEIMRKLDVDYVLVIFGGVSGYSSDDINKFLWMVRIGGGVYKDHVQEKDFLSEAVSGTWLEFQRGICRLLLIWRHVLVRVVCIGGGVYKDHVQEKDFLSEVVSG